ncbi:MAG: rod shape-determining protein MreC, partial [Bdellovibrionota bacterium]
MNFLNLNMRKIVLLFFACLLPLISINVQQKPVESTWVSRPFFLLSQGVQNVFYFFSAEVRGTTGLYLNLINVKKDNSELKTQSEKLQAELRILREKENEIDRLRKLLDFKQTTPMRLIAAEVMGKDLMTDHNTLTINKGTADGIKNGMGVITLDGVVGYIFRPDTHQASVMLVSDRYSVVDGVVQRSRARGIVEGKGTQECSLKYVERTEDVKEG